MTVTHFCYRLLSLDWRRQIGENVLQKHPLANFFLPFDCFCKDFAFWYPHLLNEIVVAVQKLANQLFGFFELGRRRFFLGWLSSAIH